MEDILTVIGQIIIIFGLIQLVSDSEEHEECKKNQSRYDDHYLQ